MERFDATVKKQGGNASISGGNVPNTPILSPTSPPGQNQFILSISLSSVAVTAFLKVVMNSDKLSSPKDSSPPATQVPPSASKQSELSLEEQIKEGQDKLDSLLLLWRQCQKTKQRTENTTATDDNEIDKIN